MCWSAEASWVTFAIGTLINIGAFGYLWYVRSWTTPIVIYWQFTLLMQIPEGIVWTQLSYGDDISSTSRALMLLNVFQPIVLTIVVWIGYRRISIYALVATFMYILLVGNEMNELWQEAQSVAPASNCPHLDLHYWNGARTSLYVFATLFSFACIPSLVWVVVNALIFIVTLLIAVSAYHCGGGSMWCWLIFVASLILVLVDVGIRSTFKNEANIILRAKHLSFNKGKILLTSRLHR